MEQQILGTTSIYGIIGYPIKHSLSPVMQNKAFTAAGINAVYVPFEVHPDRLEDTVRGLRALSVSGFNVTIPHKTKIIPYLDQLHKSAQDAAAVNTVKRVGDKLIGYNTDGDGLLRSIKQEFDFSIADKQVFMIGAGGAARGAAAAICRGGASSIKFINRTVETAKLLISELSTLYPSVYMQLLTDQQSIDDALKSADLLLNSTSLGMKGEKIISISPSLLPSRTIVYDMVYSPLMTPLLKDAESYGLRYANGLGMLSCQGEICFQYWTGKEPPPGLMKQALQSAIGVKNS